MAATRVECLRCRHVGSLTEPELIRRGVKPSAPIVSFVSSLPKMREPKRAGRAHHPEKSELAAQRFGASYSPLSSRLEATICSRVVRLMQYRMALPVCQSRPITVYGPVGVAFDGLPLWW
jgi:hypothetical protein